MMRFIKGDLIWNTENLYIEYEYEEVMFRWDHSLRKVYCKFYGETNADEWEVPYTQDLFTQATLFGNEITKEAYDKGKLAVSLNELKKNN